MKGIDWTPRQLEIMEKAGELLATSGVGGLTVKRLSSSLGFSEAALYRHFDSKESLILAMLDQVANQLRDRYEFAVTGVEDPLKAFRRLFEEQFCLFAEKPYMGAVIFSDGIFEEGEAVAAAIRRIMALRRSYLLPQIRNAQRLGLVRCDVPAEDMIAMTMGAVRLLVFEWRGSGFYFDLEERGMGLVNSILTLIKSQT